MTKQALPPPPGDRPTSTVPPPPPGWRHWLLPLAILLSFLVWAVPAVRSSTSPSKTNLSYSQFLTDVDAHQVMFGLFERHSRPRTRKGKVSSLDSFGTL